ncbi:hypothetical protein TL16_g08519 [Triparma laevis f. inornata]|uniref:Hexose transporter 1 n=2 Tax=Triparma laevis TaxID=1534972 RepID=A0A9W7AHL5_9STRA|nr:hypothetical protein TrLO_g3039 [Triparma laevis f. longispina]GMH80372.1 hypothetical protein TL16_g08519 [Triparma laevis f. inornata]
MEAKLLSVFLLFFIPALGGLLFGYDIGSTSYAVAQLQDETYSGTNWSSTASTPLIKGLLTTATTAGAFLGSIIVFTVADTIGRKRELQIGSSLYILGAIGMYASTTITDSTPAIVALSITRLIYGFGIAFSMHGAPTYIAEMSPSDWRGFLVSLKEAFIVVGILAGYAIGYVLENTEGGWKYVWSASLLVSIPQFMLLFLLPKSSRFLLLTGENDEALDSISWVFKGDVRDLYEEVKGQVDKQKEREQLSGESTSIFATKWRGALTAGVGLVVLQQVTGQPSILSYATPILDSAGLESYSSVLVGAFKIFATMFAVLYVDSYGRRKLLFIGNALMLVALITLTVTFFFGDDDSSSDDDSDEGLGPRQVITLIGMFVYIGGYQVGFGPIAWLMISECFPLEIRGQAVAFAVQMNFFWNMIVQFLVPVIQDSIGNVAMFGIFSGLTAFSIWFVNGYVPETKGLSLEEIEKFFEKQHREKSGKGKNTPEQPLLSQIV